MSRLHVGLKGIKAASAYYAEPTLEIEGTIRSEDDFQIGLAHIECDIRLSAPNLITLGIVPIFIINIPKRSEDPKRFDLFFSFSLDSANAVHNLIKSNKLGFNDEISFNISLKGFCMNLNNVENIAFNQIDHIVDLHVVDYISLLSKYYHDLSWIPISRTTYSKLKEIADREGFTSLDEVIESRINMEKNGRHEE